MSFPGQYANPPPQYQQGNPVQGSAAPPMGGQQYGGQQQQGYQGANYNMANEPAFVRGHQDMPHPGEDYHPEKHTKTRYAQVLIIGIMIGAFLMWRVYPIVSRAWNAAWGV